MTEPSQYPKINVEAATPDCQALLDAWNQQTYDNPTLAGRVLRDIFVPEDDLQPG